MIITIAGHKYNSPIFLRYNSSIAGWAVDIKYLPWVFSPRVIMKVKMT